MPEELESGELERIPVFPLVRTVLLPGALLSLQMFEPQYIQLTKDALAAGGVIAIGNIPSSLARSGAEATVAGAGRIVAHEESDDGSFQIVLQGVSRVRLLGTSDPELPYRALAFELLPDEGMAISTDITALVSSASQVARVVRSEHPDFSMGVNPGEGAGKMADRIADRFVSDPTDRQRILECENLGERVKMVTDLIGDLLALIAAREMPN